MAIEIKSCSNIANCNSNEGMNGKDEINPYPYYTRYCDHHLTYFVRNLTGRQDPLNASSLRNSLGK